MQRGSSLESEESLVSFPDIVDARGPGRGPSPLVLQKRLGDSVDEGFGLDEDDGITCLKCLSPADVKSTSSSIPYLWDVLRHIWRSSQSDLSAHVASSEEEDTIVSLYTHLQGATYAQNYLAWRRSNIFVVLFPIICNILISMAHIARDELEDYGFEFDIQQNSRELYDSISPVFKVLMIANWIQVVSMIISVILLCTGLYRWPHFRRTQYFVMLGWFFYYFSPFILTCIPFASFLNIQSPLDYHWPRNATDSEIEKQSVKYIEDSIAPKFIGVYLGAVFFLRLAPPVIAMSMATIRACLSIRTLVPQSALPGYVCCALILLYIPLSWAAFIFIVQMLGNLFLLSAFIIITFAPVIFITFRRYLTQTKTSKDAHKYVRRLGIGYAALLATAVPLLAVWILTIRIENDVIKYLFSPLAILEASLALIGEYLLTNVFTSDLLVVVLAIIRKNDLSMVMGTVHEEEERRGDVTLQSDDEEDEERSRSNSNNNNVMEAKYSLFHEHLERQNQLVKLLVRSPLDLTTKKEESIEMEKFFDS